MSTKSNQNTLLQSPLFYMSLLWKCWCMPCTGQCSVALILCVSQISLVSQISYVSAGMQRMRRNYCRSVIQLQEPLPHSLWISLDFHGILAIVWTPAYPVVSICVCWPPKRRVYNTTFSSLLHRKYLLLVCCLLKLSQNQLALIDTASVHIVKGISQHIRNRS